MKANLTEIYASYPEGAVGSFNILDLDMAFTVIEAAEALNLPAIVGIASRHFDAIDAPRLIPSILSAINQSTVPIALHLDHAAPDQYDMIKHALDLGFSSIMIDGSQLPFEENAAITARVVETAKAYGASVEGEIGGIAGEEGVADTDSDAPEDLPFTDAAEAQKFVEQTGIDALAIAVGTAHGIYTATPQISFSTIQDCNKTAGVPLVMHGATGVSDADIQKSVCDGIRKINFFSGLLKDAMDTVRQNGANSSNDYLKFKSSMQQAWKQTIMSQMQLYALQNADQLSTVNG